MVSPQELVSNARQWALDISERWRPWVATLYRTDKLVPLVEARKIFKLARAQAGKRAQNLKHPLACIDVVEEGNVSGGRAGLLKEFHEFRGLSHSDTCRSLAHIFFAQRGTTKAVPENISLKHDIFSDLEKCCPPHCILATNTSSL
ncbi:hypothetical protein Tsubulata_001896 [Turnera subulata]|uniref:3-hydroxyacyl-CoA dehydrogenase NAD binding domain-containing protein n=1 Tax=Turnera subulata TaxID=218843 RepID=A0A9Q0IYE1_9ROSI|nr:hypothetical protein Tsubulata_001896 [Turnera subulata]